MTATLLSNGQVLVAGGINAANNPFAQRRALQPVDRHLATDRNAQCRPRRPRRDAAGERPGIGCRRRKPGERVDDVGRTVQPGDPQVDRDRQSRHRPSRARRVLLANGEVLVSGGSKVHAAGTAFALASAELYNPANGSRKATGSLRAARFDHTSTVLLSGLVLDVGGANINNELASGELYTR